MAYENMTYEYIIHRMIDRITTDYPDLDIREGSIVFNAVASAAMEVAIMYTELDNVLNESFVVTASREYILVACEQVGINTDMFAPSSGFFKGLFNVKIDLESRWNLEEYNYMVLEQLDDETDDDGNTLYAYRMQCETTGSGPNGLTGNLTPIDYTNGDLTVAQLTECLIPGEDETPDEDIVDYYMNFVNDSIVDGNVKQYEEWCDEFPGIGKSKIFPLWNGDNTVKVSILDAENNVASSTLIDDFQEYLDPNVTGMGDGVAPIGAFVTVSTATPKTINVTCKVKLKEGYTDPSAINDTITAHFKDISYEKTVVSYMTLGAAILDAESVDFITNLTVNGGTADIPLGDEEIPVLGTTNWTVVT